MILPYPEIEYVEVNELSDSARGSGGFGSTGTSQNMSAAKKKVQFVDTDIRHAQLRIQLEREDLTQAEFFRACLTGMIENDATFMKYIRKQFIRTRQNIPFILRSTIPSGDIFLFTEQEV